MFKEYSHIQKGIKVLLDVLLLLLAFISAYFWRSHTGYIGPIEQYLNLFYLSAPVTIIVFGLHGLYGPMRFFSLLKTIIVTLKSLFLAGIISAAYLYLTHANYFSRLLFGYYFVSASILLVSEKIVQKKLQNLTIRRGKGLKNILIVGTGKKLDSLVETINHNPEWGFHIKSVLPFNDKVLNRTRDILETEVVDEVFVALSREKQHQFDIGRFLSVLEEYGKVIRVFINLDEELRFSHLDFFRLGRFKGLIFYSNPLDPDLLFLKRLIDLAGATVGIMLTAMLFPFIAIAIKIDSPGPIFFAQERIGMNGRRFRLYKFRSMYEDAENRKKELVSKNELNGPVFKLSNDPRVTRVGRFLRKTSLDELPQFWNVIKGDMSLVGTRPPTPDEVKKYNAWHYRRISIRPGITGLWQVSGRNKIKDFEEIVALDVKYISEWSLWLDFKILLKTVLILFTPSKSGAY